MLYRQVPTGSPQGQPTTIYFRKTERGQKQVTQQKVTQEKRRQKPGSGTSPDGIYSISVDGRNGLIKKKGKEVLSFIPILPQQPSSVIYNDNSEHALVGGKGRFRWFSLNGKAKEISPVQLVISGGIVSSKLSPKGDLLIVATSLSRLEIYNLETNRQILSKDITGLGKITHWKFGDRYLTLRYSSNVSRDYLIDYSN